MKELLEVKRSDGGISRVAIGDVIGMMDELIPSGKRVIIITDSNIDAIYGNVINRYEKIIIPRGEDNKTLATLGFIYESLMAMEADRECFIVGFGGGIVTDITGFAASTYMRGVRFGFVATTLLAQVDASVGGKNGVNFNGYKNMVGTFNQPEFVICDTSLLSSLPPREVRTGMAEVIKSGLIADAGLFELFEKYSYDDFISNQDLMFEAITRAVKVKKRIVEIDEREGGERKKLNLGHTFAHGIEKCSHDFTHGEAVAVGMAMICDVSVQAGSLTPEQAERIKRAISNIGLPISTDIPISSLCEAARSDKKRDNDSISLILMKGIGNCEIVKYNIGEIFA